MNRLRIILVVLCFLGLKLNAQVGIGTTNPDSSSALDVTSTEGGMLVPRMLVSERIAIASPAEGLLVYQTDDITGFYYFNGTQWVRLMDKARDAVPIGAVFAFPVTTMPNGYLQCDGSAVSRTTYANLFAVIGTAYGNGDGATTFNLPDYRGQFLRGFDNGSGTDPDAASRMDRGDGSTGDVVGTKQNNELNSHLHTVTPPSVTSSIAGDHAHVTNPFALSTNSSGNHTHSGTFNGTTGSGGGQLNRVYYRNTIAEDPGPFDAEVTIREVWNTGSYVNLPSTPSHSHSVSGTINTYQSGGHTHAITIPSIPINTNGNHDHTITLPAFDSATQGGNETRPTNISVIWCIKY